MVRLASDTRIQVWEGLCWFYWKQFLQTKFNLSFSLTMKKTNHTVIVKVSTLSIRAMVCSIRAMVCLIRATVCKFSMICEVKPNHLNVLESTHTA